MRAYFAAAAAAFVALSVSPILAHHSFDAEFDRNKPVDMEVTVTKVEFMNPHAWFYGDKKEADGSVSKWQFEMGAPNGLRRNGWGPNSMPVGTIVRVVGSLAKDGSNTVNATTVTIDGKRLFAGSSGGDNVPGGKGREK